MKRVTILVLLTIFSFGCTTGKTKPVANIKPAINTGNTKVSSEVHCIDIANITANDKHRPVIAVAGYANLARSLFVEEEINKFREKSIFYMRTKDKTIINDEETKINQCVELSLTSPQDPEYNKKITDILNSWEESYKVELNNKAKKLIIHEIESCKKHAQSLHLSYIKKISKQGADKQFNKAYSIYKECLNINLKRQGEK